MPHQYHLQVNRQLPFLATLDLTDLSRLTNDPIFHSPVWPVIPSKLPSDILKFDGKPGEDPNNHVMTFHLWCSSNSLMVFSSKHLWALQQSGILNYHVLLFMISTPFPCLSSHTFKYLFSTRQVLNASPPFVKMTPCISLTIFMSGDDDEG
jgi:hypothetical protein